MEDITIWLFVIIVGFFGIILLAKLAMWMNEFSKELRFLNNEIGRNDGEERRYWIVQRRRLWLSIIPFVRY